VSDKAAPGAAPAGFILLGHIVRPHGVHGAVVVSPYTDNFDLILSGRELELLSPDGQTRRPAGALKGKAAAQGLIIKLKNVPDREAAQALKGWRLGIDRARLPEADDDEVYWADFIGLELFTPEGQPIGRVVNLMEAGAGLILVAAPADNPGGELLLPYHEDFVVELDVAGGRLTLDLPPGLLEL
jgi:16S rRNA processing protein RimM